MTIIFITDFMGRWPFISILSRGKLRFRSIQICGEMIIISKPMAITSKQFCGEMAFHFNTYPKGNCNFASIWIAKSIDLARESMKFVKEVHWFSLGNPFISQGYPSILIRISIRNPLIWLPKPLNWTGKCTDFGGTIYWFWLTGEAIYWFGWSLHRFWSGNLWISQGISLVS